MTQADEPMSESARRLVGQIDEAWRPFQTALDLLGEERLELRTSAGWTMKEMLAHIAFWDEAPFGFISLAFRNQPLPEGWTFGSGYLPEDEEWPGPDVHNAREAEWARGQPAQQVLARVESAHALLRQTAASVSDAEARANGGYFIEISGVHYRNHQEELNRLVAEARLR